MHAAAGYERLPSAVDEAVRDAAAPMLSLSNGLTSEEAEVRRATHGPHTPPSCGAPRGRPIRMGCWRGPATGPAWLALAALAALTGDGAACLCVAVPLLAVSLLAWWVLRVARATARRVSVALRDRGAVVVRRDGLWQQLPVTALVPGDVMCIHPGRVLPADCIADALLEVNEAALTGESLPVAVAAGLPLRMGALVVQGEARATVQRTGGRSEGGRLAQRRRFREGMSSDLRRGGGGGLYRATAVVFLICATTVAALIALQVGVARRYGAVPVTDVAAAVLLLALHGLPLGIEAATATAVAVAGGRVARRDGVLPVRLSTIATLASVDLIFADKTGTLTTNTLEVQEGCRWFVPAYSRECVRTLAALALRWREPPRDPIDEMVIAAADLNVCDTYVQLHYEPYTPEGARTEATVRAPDGAVFSVTKGMVSAVLRLAHNGEALRPAVERAVNDLGRRGMRCLMVARTRPSTPEGADPLWEVAGLLAFLDPPRPDAAHALRRLEALGVMVRVLTGDHPLLTREVVRRLGLTNTSVAVAAEVLPSWTGRRRGSASSAAAAAATDSGDAALLDDPVSESYGLLLRNVGAYASAQPQHKCLAVEVAQRCGHLVGLVGDGLNDAPALQHADVGIALLPEDCSGVLDGDAREATAAAVGVAASTAWAYTVADAIALRPSLQSIVDAVVSARGAMAVAEGLLTFRLASALTMAVFSVASPLMATTFAGSEAAGGGAVPLPCVLSAALAGGPLLLMASLAWDRPPRARQLHQPHRWNITAMSAAAVWLAGVTVSSALALQLLLTGSNGDPAHSMVRAVGLPPVPPPHAAAALYLHLALSISLALPSCRAGVDSLCWRRRPGGPVAVIWGLHALAATSLAAFIRIDKACGLLRSPDPALRLLLLWTWLWSLGWWVVAELLRVSLSCVRRGLRAGAEPGGGDRAGEDAVTRRGEDGDAWRGRARAAWGLPLGALELLEHRLDD